MATSRKPKRSSAAPALVSHVADRLRGQLRPAQRLTVALSGGVDSIVLLDVLARVQKRMRFELHALHVNHGLSPSAAAWARFCRAQCRARGIRCRVVKVEVLRGNSTERAAREARYGALRALRTDHVALAHNCDDQGETLLLQLLRGAGVKGLAAMPLARRVSGISLLRPLLDVTRAEIEHYARRRKLEWIEDESNFDARYTRNWLRHDILPRIETRVPAYRETLARAARHLGAATELLDDLARIDSTHAVDEGRLRVEALRALAPARGANLLRFLIDAAGWPLPDSDRLSEALRQAVSAGSDARVAVDLGGCEMKRHGGLVYLLPRAVPASSTTTVVWRGECDTPLPVCGGVLTMVSGRGEGLSAAQLVSAYVSIRRRTEGERLQPDAKRPRRTVKNLLQEARIPPWEREQLPFIYCGETLACIPGVAVDWRFRAGAGEPSIAPAWRPGTAERPR